MECVVEIAMEPPQDLGGNFTPGDGQEFTMPLEASPRISYYLLPRVTLLTRMGTPTFVVEGSEGPRLRFPA